MVHNGMKVGAALSVLTLASTAGLAGCEQRAAPPTAYAASAHAPRATELAGDPHAAPPPPVEEASPSLPPPPPPPPHREDEVVYDLGPVVPAPGLVTMQPIPNDYRAPEAGAHAASHLTERRATAEGHVGHGAARRRHRLSVAPAAGAAHRRPVEAGRTPASPSTSRAAPAHPAAGRAASPRSPSTADRAQSPAVSRKAPAAAHDARTGERAKAKPAARPAAPSAVDRGARLQSLQTALRDAASAKAQLGVPRLAPNTPAEVVLTLPADFAQTARDEAAKAGLEDAAASVNLTASLSGDGYAVTPDEVQARPLTLGQPTEFRWTVTAQPGARGPLRADLGADLLGGGRETLALGAVTTSAAGRGLSSRALGAGLLVLIVLAVLAWLARGGRSRQPRETVVRRSTLSGDHRTDLNGDREHRRPHDAR